MALLTVCFLIHTHCNKVGGDGGMLESPGLSVTLPLCVCVCVCVCVSVCVSVSVRYLFLCTTHPFITKSSVVGHHQEPEHHAKKWVTNLVQTLTLKLQYSCIFFQSVSNGLGVSVGDGNISSILAHSHTACLPIGTV